MRADNMLLETNVEWGEIDTDGMRLTQAKSQILEH